MKIGVPKEIKNHEYRVGLIPAGVAEYVRRGHEVFVEKGAGEGSAITDDIYLSVGATLLDTADEVWDVADMIMLAVTQSPNAHTPVLSLYTTSNPEIEMIKHW